MTATCCQRTEFSGPRNADSHPFRELGEVTQSSCMTHLSDAHNPLQSLLNMEHLDAPGDLLQESRLACLRNVLCTPCSQIFTKFIPHKVLLLCADISYLM